MKKKRSKKMQLGTTRPNSAKERVQNIMQVAPNTEKSNHNHKFIWDPKKQLLPVDIEDTPMLPLRREDISHS